VPGSDARPAEAIHLELVCERLPDCGVTAADVAGDYGAALVEDGDGGVSVESEGAGELGARVGKRGPRPAVLVQESLGVVSVVGDIQADEPVLRVALRKARVGDRLAVADGSPGGPDVDEDRLPAEVGK
ncbi:MAG: hypothetical protein ACRDNC_13515, partial [Gaiellaceae bacterium]